MHLLKYKIMLNNDCGWNLMYISIHIKIEKKCYKTFFQDKWCVYLPILNHNEAIVSTFIIDILIRPTHTTWWWNAIIYKRLTIYSKWSYEKRKITRIIRTSQFLMTRCNNSWLDVNSFNQFRLSWNYSTTEFRCYWCYCFLLSTYRNGFFKKNGLSPTHNFHQMVIFLVEALFIINMIITITALVLISIPIGITIGQIWNDDFWWKTLTSFTTPFSWSSVNWFYMNENED